ncbi:MAG: DNA-processing protein DprA [Oscillospiraceae bacterium]|nr:DNA-processing protein DprA [Oscillospiraceae bacterium]
MIKDEDIIYWVWLSQLLGAGNPDVEYVLSNIDSPKDLYNLCLKNRFENIKFLSKYLINKAKTVKLDDAAKIIKKCKEKRYEIITIRDEIYPNRLKNIYSSPLVLYISGSLDSLYNIDNILSIAIVGSRKCSEYASEVTKLFSSELSKNKVMIISGMAVGIDGIALREALKNKSGVIGVLGCGLDVNYPIQNLDLKKQIESSPNGCVISEYPPGVRPFSAHFPVRNRIMAGLSSGVLVVEAGERSGSLITAKIATEQGKDVYGVPNNIFLENNFGTMNLLKEGAILVTEPRDILENYKYNNYKLNNIKNKKNNNIYNSDLKDYNLNYNLNSDKLKQAIDKFDKKDYNLNKQNNNLTGVLKDIYELLGSEGPQSADYISDKLNISINEILVSITELEILGLIKNFTGMKYKII